MIKATFVSGKKEKIGKASWNKKARGAVYNHQLSGQRNEMKGEMKSG